MRLIFSLDGNHEAVGEIYRSLQQASLDLIHECLLEKEKIDANKDMLHNAAIALIHPLLVAFDELLECAFSVTLDGNSNDFTLTQEIVTRRFRELMDEVDEDFTYPPEFIPYLNKKYDPLSLIGGAKLTALQGKVERAIMLFLQNEVTELHCKVKNFTINFNL